MNNSSILLHDLNDSFYHFFLESLKNYIGINQFNAWFNDAIYSIDQNTNTIIITTPDHYAARHINDKYFDSILKICQEILDNDVNLSIITTSHANNSHVQHSFGLKQYTFDNFIEDDSNALALYICKGLARYSNQYNVQPGTLIYLNADVGCGKTHLSQAVMEYYTSVAGNAIYLSAEQFTAEFIKAVKNNSTFDFKQEIINKNLLIIDDLHFLISRKSTINILTNIINNMLDVGKMILLTSAMPKNQLNIDAGLLSRITAGIDAKIDTPRKELKYKIITQLAKNRNIKVSNDFATTISQNDSYSIREIHGIINKMSLMQSCSGQQISSLDTDQMNMTKLKLYTVENIINHVSAYYGVSPQSIKSKMRTRAVIMARYMTIYLMRNMLQMSYSSIASIIGMANHTSIMYAIKRSAADTSFLSDAKVLEIKISS